MFTGLVQAVGKVVRVEPSSAGVRLLIDPSPWPYEPSVGDSISINGCCLTVAARPMAEGPLWGFDAIPETLSKTTLGTLVAGSRVNLEPAATPSTLLGGHVAQGHVDGVAEVVSVQTSPEYRIRLRPPSPLMEFIAPKGSVCIDGVSLTIAALDTAAGWFEVALIPTTLEKTTLASLRGGDPCNLETDAMAKTIVHWLKHYGSK